MVPGMTTVIASRAGMQRMNQDGIMIDTPNYHSHVAVPQKFEKWKRAVSGVFKIAMQNFQGLATKFETVTVNEEEEKVDFNPSQSREPFEPS